MAFGLLSLYIGIIFNIHNMQESPMLTSNLSHCFRYGTQAKPYDMMEFCQPNTKHVKGKFRTLLTWVCPRIVIDQGIWRCSMCKQTHVSNTYVGLSQNRIPANPTNDGHVSNVKVTPAFWTSSDCWFAQLVNIHRFEVYEAWVPRIDGYNSTISYPILIAKSPWLIDVDSNIYRQGPKFAA